MAPPKSQAVSAVLAIPSVTPCVAMRATTVKFCMAPPESDSSAKNPVSDRMVGVSNPSTPIFSAAGRPAAVAPWAAAPWLRGGLGSSTMTAATAGPSSPTTVNAAPSPET